DDGSFNYVPDPGFVGKDTFTYKGHDQDGDSETDGDSEDPATVTINVGVGVKDHDYPVARDGNLAVDLDHGLLKDATGAQSGNLTAELVSGVSHGTLALADDGTFTYTPVPGYRGPDSFTYQAKDGGLTSNTATVNLTVGAPPKAVDDTYRTGIGTPLI